MLNKQEENSTFHKILIICTISFSMLITNLDISIVNIALPTLAKQYSAGTEEVSRIILLYVLAMAAFLPVFGKISDNKGTEKIFTLGYIVFSVSSLLCALSPNLLFLHVSRFIQGIGAAMLLANFAAITIKYLPADFRGRAFGFISVFAGIGISIGPPVGGYILKYLNWRWIFFINVPVGLVATLLTLKLLNYEKPLKSTNEKFDFVGAISSISGLMCLVYLLNTGNSFGWYSIQSIVLFSVSAVLLLVFLITESKVQSPLIDFSYLKNKYLAFGLLTAFLLVLVFDGLMFVFPFFFELVKNYSPEKTGLIIMLCSISSFILSPVSGYLSDKYSPRIVLRFSLILFLIANVMFFTYTENTSLGFFQFSFVIFGISLALFFAANTSLVMSYAEEGKEAMLSALVSFNTYFATILGVSLFQILLSANYSLENINDKNRINFIPKVLAGYKNSTKIGIVIAILACVAVIFAREKIQNQEIENDGKHQENRTI